LGKTWENIKKFLRKFWESCPS